MKALTGFGHELEALGWVSDLLVGGSLATGDYRPGVSDLDLVAVTDGPVGTERQAALVALHRRLDDTTAKGLKLGCSYVDSDRRTEAGAEHPTWTHGQMVQRIVSGVTRAELVRHGHAVFGRAPRELFPPVTDDDIRRAARAELVGPWAWAARRPWVWLDPGFADLGLTSMARGRHGLRTGQLLTKSEAVERAAAPVWLVEQLRLRRRGEAVSSPRLRTAWFAWRDAWRTTRRARHYGPF
ncbi:nucleotidyltransferase domain-containing protein [Actinoplanes sp. LDG1-06]|uniref:Nucleotidyltransferase domain-containing protein n=1 Tax=Paractinoplanes ovalisporus TaxID=2810368 RepID=A0ABS2AFA2_9ACTN|nr:nucleotidyltransferase domain-containing protein [Actinoplanes ovalisporus]MBM2618506.1 nucleotidyltransferase domain-containing protein [Actinoplanes ovalisporus]